MLLLLLKWVENTTFGNGVKVNVGNEIGGLKITAYADLLYNDLRDIMKKEVSLEPHYL